MSAPRQRKVILTLDTLAELLKDYIGPDTIPPDAMAQRLMINPSMQGMLALEVASPSIKFDAKDINVNFNIRRVYSV